MQHHRLGGPKEPPPEPYQNTRNGGYMKDQAGPPCGLHHRSREKPAGRSSTMNILGITIDERLSVSDHVDTILLIKLPVNSQSERDAKENPSPGNSHDDDRSVDVWLTNLVGLFEQTGP